MQAERTGTTEALGCHFLLEMKVRRLALPGNPRWRINHSFPRVSGLSVPLFNSLVPVWPSITHAQPQIFKKTEENAAEELRIDTRDVVACSAA